MMHSSHKRRRVDAASTLSRPFKSPFRADPTQNSPSQPVLGAQHCTTPAAEQTTISHQHSRTSPASSPIRNTASNGASPSSQSSPLRKEAREVPTVGPFHLSHRTNSATSYSPFKSADPEYAALQKQHTRLLTEVASLRKSTDTTQQALSLEASNQDDELESLINKWRGIAREAAEELFRVAKDKVNRMGGVNAWRERTQKRNTPWAEEDKQPWSNPDPYEEIDEDSLTDEQKDALAEMKEEAAEDMRKYGMSTVPEQKVATEGPEQGKDEVRPAVHAAHVTYHFVSLCWFMLGFADYKQTFTMDMMLKQLNVELDIIGYDVEMQRWTE